MKFTEWKNKLIEGDEKARALTFAVVSYFSMTFFLFYLLMTIE